MSGYDDDRVFPPLDDAEAWTVDPELLEEIGCSAEEAEASVIILKTLAALGLNVAEAEAFVDECDDVPGSKAWRKLHQLH